MNDDGWVLKVASGDTAEEVMTPHARVKDMAISFTDHYLARIAELVAQGCSDNIEQRAATYGALCALTAFCELTIVSTERQVEAGHGTFQELVQKVSAAHGAWVPSATTSLARAYIDAVNE